MVQFEELKSNIPTSKQINTFKIMEYNGGEQPCQVIDMEYEMAYKSITGGIFEAGFSDSILQMCGLLIYMNFTMANPSANLLAV